MPSYYSTTSKEAPAAAPSAAPQWFPRGAAAALLVAAGAFLLTLGAAQLATALAPAPGNSLKKVMVVYLVVCSRSCLCILFRSASTDYSNLI